MISVLSESQTMAAYRWGPRFRRDSVEELLVATGSWNAAWEPRRRGRVPSVPETLPDTHDDLERTGRWHYSDVTWASWCLRSLAKSTVYSQLHKNENIKATNYCPFVKVMATRIKLTMTSQWHHTSVTVSQITSKISTVCSTAISGLQQREYLSCASVALCEGNPLMTGNMESVLVSWRHHEYRDCLIYYYFWFAKVLQNVQIPFAKAQYCSEVHIFITMLNSSFN